jgi:hypothetical protein
MPETNIPRRTASLDPRGVRKLANLAKTNPDQAKAIADALERDPKATIVKLFRLSSSQAQAIYNTTNEDLKARVQPAIEAIREGNLDGIDYEPGTPDPTQIKCTCWMEVEWN